MERILIVADSKRNIAPLEAVLNKEGYRVKSCSSSEQALGMMDADVFDLILAEAKLLGLGGIEILRLARESKPGIPVIMIAAPDSARPAAEALKLGAAAYVMMPFDEEELELIVSRALEIKRLAEENMLLKDLVREKFSLKNMVGKSKGMKEVFRLIEKVAATDSTVFIAGESGTGKETAARALHFQSRRSQGRFISFDCSTVPESLLENELFGQVQDACRSSVSSKKGMFERAEKGTLFLDEVAGMSPRVQAQLLKTLKEKKIWRVGGTEEIPVDVRLVTAASQDLKQKVAEGKFRKNLYSCLKVISFEMPPLRARKEDIPLLASHFTQKHCRKMGKRNKRFAPEIMALLEAYSWPGNVRELENVIERIVAIEDRETITEECLPKEILHAQRKPGVNFLVQPGFSLSEALDEISRNYILQALEASDWNLKESAFLLGISYRSLRYLTERLGIKNHRAENGRTSRGEVKGIN